MSLSVYRNVLAPKTNVILLMRLRGKISKSLQNLEFIVITRKFNYYQTTFALGWREACVIRTTWHKQMSATKP